MRPPFFPLNTSIRICGIIWILGSSLLSVLGYITSVIEYKHVRQRYDAGLGWMVFIRYRVLVSKKQHQWLRFRTEFWLRTLQST